MSQPLKPLLIREQLDHNHDGGRKKPINTNNFFGIVPGMGGGQIVKHINKTPRRMPGQSRDSPRIIPGQSCENYVYVFSCLLFFGP